MNFGVAHLPTPIGPPMTSAVHPLMLSMTMVRQDVALQQWLVTVINGLMILAV